jgi:hypothetical protein
MTGLEMKMIIEEIHKINYKILTDRNNNYILYNQCIFIIIILRFSHEK